VKERLTESLSIRWYIQQWHRQYVGQWPEWLGLCTSWQMHCRCGSTRWNRSYHDAPISGWQPTRPPRSILCTAHN